MKKNAALLFCALMIAFQTLVPQPGASAGEFQKMTIQIGSATPAGLEDSWCNLVEAVSERLEEWTGGAVKLEYLGSGQLGNDAELAEAIMLGTIDGAIITTSTLSSSVPSMGIFDMPYIFANRDVLFDFIDNATAVKKIENGILDHFNAKTISWGFNGYRNVLNNLRPIRNAGDFRNMKIRVMESPVYIQLFRLLGANPTPMSISECITGLEQGTVDGMDHPISAAVSEGTGKLVKYYDLTNHTCTTGILVLNGDFYNSLPPELQEMLQRAGDEAKPVQRRKLIAREEEGLSKIAGFGAAVGRDVDIASIQEKVKPMWKDYRPNLDPEVFDEAIAHIGITLE